MVPCWEVEGVPGSQAADQASATGGEGRQVAPGRESGIFEQELVPSIRFGEADSLKRLPRRGWARQWEE
jgi:hypothetical protein